MTTSRRIQLRCLIALAIGTATSTVVTVRAQSRFPVKPIRLVVGVTPGGGADFVARLLADKLATALGQPVIVDNRPGAGGNIAAELVANAAPDGHTLLVVNSSHASNVNLYRKLSYDPVKSFSPVSQLTANYFLLAVRPSLPARSIAELVALAKSSATPLTYASAGAGQGGHLGMELFRSQAGFEATHVPYSGIAPATTAVLAGHVDVALLTPPSTIPHMEAGKLKVLGVTGPRRLKLLPDIPSFEESGFGGFEVNNWQALLVPAGTPLAIVAKLQRETARSLALLDVKERLAAAGTEAVGSTPEELGVFLSSEILKWGQVIQRSGAKVD